MPWLLSRRRLKGPALVLLLVLLGDCCRAVEAWSHNTIRQNQQQQQQQQYHHRLLLPAVLTEPPPSATADRQQLHKKERKISKISSSSMNNVGHNSKAGNVPHQPQGDNEEKSSTTSSAIQSDESSPPSIVASQEAIWKPPKLRYYAILGVESTATCQQIKTHYRKLAKIYHPDANPHRDTTEAFSLLNRAYEVLMHPELRQRYDLYGRQGVGTSALSDSEKIVETINQQPKDWTQVLVEPYKTVVVVNQTNNHGDDQDVKWKKDPPPYEERLVPYRYPTVQLKQAVNEERSYGHIVQDYQSLANTNWETCMKNSMDETKYVRPRRSLTCLYRILGVPPQATAEQLQQAFAVATEDYHPTMDLAVGNNRQIYAHYHHVKKAYDILKIPALRNKYNQYGFEGLSQLKYAQAKVTNRYAPYLSEGWDPDGPTQSKVPIGIGARVLNDFCAPNMAAMSFDSSGVEYKSLGELGSIIATHPGTVDWMDHDDGGTVLTGGGGVTGKFFSSSSSEKPKKRQKFFTISPLPIGTHFQAAGPIPLEDLFEMELENSDGSDDELFMNQDASPIIAGPVQFAPLSDLSPIRFQDGASVSVNGRGMGVGITGVRTTPAVKNMGPIETNYKPLFPKSSTKSSSNEPIPWPLSNIDHPVASSSRLSTRGKSPVPPPQSQPQPPPQQQGRRRKFFTIAPLPVGKAYQRAPKLSVDELFEMNDSLEATNPNLMTSTTTTTITSSTRTSDEWSREMQTIHDDHSTPPIPFPDLQSIPKPGSKSHSSGRSGPVSKQSTTMSVLTPSSPSIHREMMSTPTGHMTTPTPITTAPSTTISTIPSSAPSPPQRLIPMIRLYTIPPLLVGQAYTGAAPSVDRAVLLEAVGHVADHPDDVHVLSVVPAERVPRKSSTHPVADAIPTRLDPSSKERNAVPPKISVVTKEQGQGQEEDDKGRVVVINYHELLRQASSSMTDMTHATRMTRTTHSRRPLDKTNTASTSTTSHPPPTTRKRPVPPSSPTIPPRPKSVVLSTLRSQQDSENWKDAQRRLEPKPIPATLYFSKSAYEWNHHDNRRPGLQQR